MKKVCFVIALFCLCSCGDDEIVLRYHKKNAAYAAPQSRVDAQYDRTPNILIEKNKNNLPVVAVLLGAEKGRYYVHKDYVDSLRAAGLYPMFAPYVNTGPWLAKINPAAIMTVGGAFGDFHKASVQWHNEEAGHADMRRAVAYQVAIDYARNYNLPYLGICAGAQELGIHLGGALQGDINRGMPKIFHNDGNIHGIKIKENSLLYKIVGQKEIDANSYHNGALHKPSGGAFNITANSADGHIEAIEPSKPWNEFVIGVQWHPEKNAGDCETKNPDCKIFAAFADAARNYAKRGGRQQIRVVVPDANDSRAVVQLWLNNQLIKTFDGFVGDSGATALKMEGDMKTPIGTFEIKRAFGTDPNIDTKIPYQVMTDRDVWCDDSESKLYNTLQKRGVRGCESFEDMNVDAYKYGLVIEHNTDSPKPWEGSAIFMHVGTLPTAGCVAVSEPAMREILEWIDPARQPRIKIVALNDDGFHVSAIPAKIRDKNHEGLAFFRLKRRTDDGRIYSGEYLGAGQFADDIIKSFREAFRKKESDGNCKTTCGIPLIRLK